jgi:hypothetical protein
MKKAKVELILDYDEDLPWDKESIRAYIQSALHVVQAGEVRVAAEDVKVYNIMEYLECDHCHTIYTDAPSLADAKKGAESWKKMCEKDDDIARGIAPCPNISCQGELILKNTEKLWQ